MRDEIKKCTACGESLSIDRFYFNKRFERHETACKKCRNAATWTRRKANPERMMRRAVVKKKWKQANPERTREQARKDAKAFKARNPNTKQNPIQKMRSNMRKRLRDILKGYGSSRVSLLTGCSSNHLKSHIQSLFVKGMTWENYGTHWHLDHIIPCAAFDHENPNQLRQCWHWTNLQPLEASKNLTKSDKITRPQMSLCL